MVFTEIDHAAADEKFGIDMRPRTVVVFGNPKLGTPVMAKTPLLAIDNPPKALVWEDDQAKVWQPITSTRQFTPDMERRRHRTTRRSRNYWTR